MHLSMSCAHGISHYGFLKLILIHSLQRKKVRSTVLHQNFMIRPSARVYESRILSLSMLCIMNSCYILLLCVWVCCKNTEKNQFGGTSDSHTTHRPPLPKASVTTTTHCNDGKFHECKNEYSMVHKGYSIFHQVPSSLSH